MFTQLFGAKPIMASPQERKPRITVSQSLLPGRSVPSQHRKGHSKQFPSHDILKTITTMEEITSVVDNSSYSAGSYCRCTGGNNCYYYKSVAVKILLRKTRPVSGGAATQDPCTAQKFLPFCHVCLFTWSQELLCGALILTLTVTLGK